MADTRTPEQRRHIMQSVAQKDTGPELVVRRLLHAFGYRYRLHDKRLPGSPDLVFPTRRKAIFVHGCFWHGHGCPKGKPPKSRSEYWLPKIRGNQERDLAVSRELVKLGWSVLTVWQCETKDPEALATRLVAFLGESGKAKRS
jgi:DNA mismatch endonuclease (patch repair protein)